MSARGSIHSKSAKTKHTDPEHSEDVQDSSQSVSYTESSSDNESIVRQSPKLKLKSKHPSSPKLSPKSRQQQLKQKNFTQSYAPESYTPASKVSNSSTILFTGIFIIIAIVGLVLSYFTMNLHTNVTTAVAHTTKKECSFENMRKHYPNQDSKVWKYLTVGMESILNKRVSTPGVYLFVHQGGQKLETLIRNISSHSASCFGQKMSFAEMKSSDFDTDEVDDDYGNAIVKFKEKIVNNNVVLVVNLNEIPAKAARALHAICDTHSPIATDVVIFLTLTVTDIDRDNIESITEDALLKLWQHDLKYNELGALITRVTDQVLLLRG